VNRLIHRPKVKNMKFQAPKGTRDFYPEDMAARNWIMEIWRRVSLRNGFEEYDGPIFELLDLYKAKSGEGIVSELFHFEDRGGRELAIRPEMTPTLARMIAARANSLARPIKWFSVPRLCRAERPQRGRLREFFQWNIDVVGIDDVVSDAECVLVAIDFFREVGLTPDDVVMKVNSRSLLSSLLAAQGFEKQRHEEIFAVLDKRDKLPWEAFVETVEKVSRDGEEKTTLLSIGQAAGPEGLAGLTEMAKENAAAEAELDRLRQLLALLTSMGVGEYCRFDMGVVRGLAYYTGVVFEAFGKGEFQRAICGGGRYGRLLEAVGGPPMSGIGFGTSDVVILTLLAELNRLPAEATKARRVDLFLIDADPSLFDEVLALAARLRRIGLAAEFSYRRQALGKQLKQASACSASRAVIVGSEYTQRQAVSVKDLASGEQVEIGVDRFLANPHGWPWSDSD
jgi:histidyl-tRNA synthetase